jgi:adenosylmethionine-8-amino-7-oxononanoate aminotransferase
VWHPCTQMKQHETLPLVPIARGKGAWLYDFDGRRYLDAVSSWWVNLFGHAHPAINAAIGAQLEALEHAMLAGFTHQNVIELSERLAALAPGALGHCFYGSDGASAVEIALKMSAHYWRNRGQPEKNGFVSVVNGYHGETLGALSVTDVALFRDAYAPLLRRNVVAPSPDARLATAGVSPRDHALAAAGALEAILAERHATIAALIAEPLVQGAAGMAMHHPAYLVRAREACTRYGVHLIADEIMTGFGRTGTMFACEQAGVAPDLMCVGKALTGGYVSMGATLCTDEVAAGVSSRSPTSSGVLMHGPTYMGNPLAAAVSLASVELLVSRGWADDVHRLGARLDAGLAPARELPAVLDVRVLGAIGVLEMRADVDLAWATGFLAERGVWLRPFGRLVYTMPAYVMPDRDVDRVTTAMVELAAATAAPA